MTLFIGPSLLSGIGQMLFSYSKLFPGSTYIVLGEGKYVQNADVFIFALPTSVWLSVIPTIMKTSRSFKCMTICETETVHESYGILFDQCPAIIVSSYFCKTIFERQFPGRVTCTVLHHTFPRPPLSSSSLLTLTDPYVFYHIGNIMDPRKNIVDLVNAFIECDFGDKARLLLKATCKDTVQQLDNPNIDIVNGLLSLEDLEKIHETSHCYVTFSHSEGLGLGAVEAAIRGKPVIMSSYGACKEYVKTPYLVPCTLLVPLGQDDFLFKKDMLWGEHSKEHLIKYMKDAFSKKLTAMDHSWSNQFISELI
jgi:glycosyltransferase involved in cell wall biosynthesis